MTEKRGFECVSSLRLAYSVGGETYQGKSQDPVAWIAFAEETKRMKPIDKAIFWVVRESLGCNESERIGGLEIPKPRG
jgi:hypothetical protein